MLLGEEDSIKLLRNCTNPKQLSGYWEAIHVLAATPNNLGEAYAARQAIEKLLDHIPCPKCKSHMDAYRRKKPLDQCFNDWRRQMKPWLRLWDWTYDAHEFVNNWLKKDTPLSDTAYGFFRGEIFIPCVEECNEGSPPSVPAPPPTTKSSSTAPFRLRRG